MITIPNHLLMRKAVQACRIECLCSSLRIAIMSARMRRSA